VNSEAGWLSARGASRGSTAQRREVLLVECERAGVEGASPEVEAVYWFMVGLVLWGWAHGAALSCIGGALRHELPRFFRRQPCGAPERPHVRPANAEGFLGNKLAPTRAILREGCPFGESGRRAVRALDRSA